MRAFHVSLVDEVGHRSVQARMVARFGVVLERSQDCVSSRRNAFLAREGVGAIIALVSGEVGCRCGSEASLYPNAEVAIIPMAAMMLAWAEIRELRLLIANKASVLSTRT